MRNLVLVAMMLALPLGTALAADDGAEFLKKAAAARGDVAKLKNWKTHTLKGTLKFYHGGGYSKADIEVYLQKPDKYAELVSTINGDEGTIINAKDAIQFSRKAVRTLAPDEVESEMESFKSFDVFWKMAEGASDLKPAGKETLEVADMEDKTKVECLKFERSEGKEKSAYFFNAETGQLVRVWSFEIDRTGAEIESYSDFLEYQDFNGVQFPLTQNIYQKVEEEDGSFKTHLVRRLSTDEVELDGELDQSVFAPRKNPFAGVSDVQELAKVCADAFKARDPNFAKMAQNAMVSAGTGAAEAVKAWKSGDDAALKHFASMILIRTGRKADADQAYVAETCKTKGSKDPDLGITVKAIGHAGYMLMADNKVVVIDAPFQKGLFGVAEPALDSTSISRADVILFSSSRRTCFDPAEAKAAAAKTGAKIIGPGPVIELLSKEGVPKESLVELAPKADGSASAQAAGLKITAFRTKSQQAVHNAYLIEWGSFKTLHLCSTLEYAKLKMDPAKGSALVFLPLMCMDSKAADFLKALGGARYFIPTHLNEKNGILTEIKNRKTDANLTLFSASVPVFPNDDVKF